MTMRKLLKPRVSTRTIVSILAAVIVPPVVTITLVILNEEFHPLGPGRLDSVWWVLVACLLGFLFLVREFRVYALAIALFYFPAMWWFTVMVGMSIVIGLYGL